jgi:putative ABC transport system ATP-binding protein
MLIARGLEKRYASAGRELTVLRDVSFGVEAGEFVAVVGPSGSGKTTLLSVLAGLDLPTRGSVRLDGTDLGSLSEDDRARLRREKIGFVFQSFQLLPSLTAQENVQVPLELAGARGARGRARELLERVGLAERTHHFPAQLSGGEQQRVALARAFVHRPRILFADEPTGNLDSETGGAVADLLEELNRELGTTLILVTHEDLVARRARRVLRLADGRLVGDSRSA